MTSDKLQRSLHPTWANELEEQRARVRGVRRRVRSRQTVNQCAQRATAILNNRMSLLVVRRCVPVTIDVRRNVGFAFCGRINVLRLFQEIREKRGLAYTTYAFDSRIRIREPGNVCRDSTGTSFPRSKAHAGRAF